MQGTNKHLSFLERISPNLLLLILFSILLIFTGALTSIVLFTYENSIQIIESNNDLATENNRLNNFQINQTREIPLQNLELLKNINDTQSGLIGLNDNLLTIYGRILGLANTTNVNTDSNEEMLTFLRDNFDEQFLAEYKTNNEYQQATLDKILKSVNNLTSLIKNMSTR